MSFYGKPSSGNPLKVALVRRAFTLIELLVVIGILGVLVGLLLPAVQKARQSADRVMCLNNLKQLAIACHHYHDVQGSFPPGYSASGPYTGGENDTAPGWGWAAYLLPHLEQDGLFEQIDFSRPVPRSPAAIQSVVNVLICPSDVPPSGPVTVVDAFGNPLALAGPSSYAACSGGDESETFGPSGEGVFYRNSQTRLTDIADGTSETILVGERASANAQGIWAGAIDDGVVRRGPLNPTPGAATFPAPTLVLAHSHLNNATLDTDGGLDDFSSRHPGGSNFVFADGHAAFIVSIPADLPGGGFTPNSVAFQALGTRAGGEVILGLDY